MSLESATNVFPYMVIKNRKSCFVFMKDENEAAFFFETKNDNNY